MTRATILPTGWQCASIGDVCRIFAGVGFPLKLQGRTTGEVPFFKVGDISKAWVNKESVLRQAEHYVTLKDVEALRGTLLPEGAVAFAKIGAAISLNRRAILGQPSLVDNNCFAVHASPEHVDRKYLFHYLCTIRFGDLTRASVVPSLRKSDVSNAPFPLSPFAEQRRIVSKIEELFSELDAGVAALERGKANLARYRASVLKAAVEGKLTAQWRKKNPDVEPASKLLERILKERRKKWEQVQLAKYEAAKKAPPKNWRDKYKEPPAPESIDLPMLPDNWVWATVEQLTTKVVDGVHKKPDYVSEGIPFVTVRNLTAGPDISFEDLRYISLNDHLEYTKRTNPEEGDLLVSKDGTLGVTRVVKTRAPFSVFVSVALVKPVDRRLSEFMEVAFSSPVMQRQMVGKGSGLQHIHLEDLRKDCVPLPPIVEQGEIVTEVEQTLSAIREAEDDVSRSDQRCKRLRQAVLKRAFEGKLVPQDPRDESASRLLECIKAERGGAQLKKRNVRCRRRTAKNTL